MHKNETEPTFHASRSVAVVGARGYSGLELCRLLMRHPGTELRTAFATERSFSLSHYLPEEKARRVRTVAVTEFEASLAGIHTVFLATPAEASLELAEKALKCGVNVIDLSGAFRLGEGTPEEIRARYLEWYGFEPHNIDLLKRAEYGLVPWVHERASESARLVANPGCYATAIAMAILPLLKTRLIHPESLVIDAKSGTTGAGRKASENLLFSEVEGECLPYKVARHQHWPEIVASARVFAASEISPFFTTHLLNTRRGIIASIYARLTRNGIGDEMVETAYQEFYRRYPLVRFGALGRGQSDTLLSLKRVVGSARTHISFRVDGEKLYLFSTIDNLLKGAAGQAVENFNRLLGLPIDTGLLTQEGVL